MAKKFASQGDMSDKTISFTEIGRDLWAFTAEGDPNTGVIIGDDSVMVIDAQATPRLADMVVEKIRTVSDKPIKHVVLSHYHAVRVLGASAYDASSAGRKTGTASLRASRACSKGMRAFLASPGRPRPSARR